MEGPGDHDLARGLEEGAGVELRGGIRWDVQLVDQRGRPRLQRSGRIKAGQGLARMAVDAAEGAPDVDPLADPADPGHRRDVGPQLPEDRMPVRIALEPAPGRQVPQQRRLIGAVEPLAADVEPGPVRRGRHAERVGDVVRGLAPDPLAGGEVERDGGSREGALPEDPDDDQPAARDGRGADPRRIAVVVPDLGLERVDRIEFASSATA